MDYACSSVFRETGSIGENIKVHGNEFFRILHFYKQKAVFVLVLLVTIVSGILPMLMMIILGDAFDASMGNDFLGTFTKGLLKVAYMNIAMIVLLALAFSLRGFADKSFVKNLRDKIFSNIMEQDISYFDETSSGMLMARLSEDVTFVLNTYVEKLLTAVQYIVQIIGGIIIGFIYSWRITVICALIVPICLILYYVGEYFVSKKWLEFRDSSAYLSGKAEEVLTGFRTVKSFDNELYEYEEYSKGLDDVHKIVVKTAKIHAIKNSLLFFFVWGINVPLFYYGSYLSLKKPQYGVTPGDIVIMSGIFSNIGIAAAMCTTLIDDMRKAGISAAKLLMVIDKKPKIKRDEGEDLNGLHIKGKIEFKDVSFKYQTRDDYAVEHLSFTVNPGETVALVGESGCGKSTTLQLLQRFYEIDQGGIFLDDVNIKQYSPYSIRNHISIVSQTPVLFSMSVLDNIRYGKPDSQEAEVVEAAQIGNAHNFIMELPNGYDTEVQQMSLSGGQKQRICISRSILTKSPILLLDEATAALDTESEQLVQQSLERYRHGKTAIIVAHRLATVRNADRILVFQNGRIVEEGTHDNLLEQSGIYSNLVKYQLQ
ncbi:hypothetical protein M9Y10_026818 [Tritrichomonas musculus]|uniref:ABC transporter family protein n=1 Tax=Tritrichomonas musculus TaxID=1915356 RepID=A0ABR2H7N9_9EUKA